jgi:radical SAM superfamily enzyme YgiQ (UPF0313 family)
MGNARLLIVTPARDQNWWSGGKVLAPPLVLPLLAGLTPAEIDVQLVDENVEPTDTNAEVDAVAISCMTASAPRAYKIAEAFRRRGIPTVMGGIHPTVLPEEAEKHADAIVVGEAELIWQEVLADLARGKLKRRYQADKYFDMKKLPLPRRDLLKRDRYLTVNVVQTARGCPNACTFCSVSTVAGRRYRFRPVEQVVKEVRTLNGWVGFVDDNIAGNPSRARQLFEALIPLKIRWIGQADLNLAWDLELLKLAVLSGCKALFMGFESLSPENLRTTHKTPNIRTDMAGAIENIHRAGIEIIGSFVLGLDGDDQSVFAKTVQFAQRQKLVAAQFSVLTPFPGTVISRQLEQENRILDHDWSHYTMSDVVFRPKNMTAEELYQGRQWTYRTFYSLSSIFARSLTRRGQIALKWLVNGSYRAIGYNKGLAKGLPSI